MMEATVRRIDAHGQRPTTTTATAADVLMVLRAIQQEQSELRRLFSEFAGVYLNSKFPHGRGTDRWARR